MAGTDPHSVLTPKERLALSRRALVRELNGGRDEDPPAQSPEQQRARDDAAAAFDAADPDDAGAAFEGQRAHDARSPRSNFRIWTSVGRSMAERWWRRHPAHAVGQLARPVLEHYARTQPAKLMGIAAGTGALLVLVKPWRLLSVTAVLAAALKTSDLADVVNTLMQQRTTTPRKDPP